MSLCEPVSFQSVELPTQEVWGCLYHEITHPVSFCVLFFLFWSRISFLRFPVHLGEDCSVLVVNFFFFRREDELQSFYSTILISSSCTKSLAPPDALDHQWRCVWSAPGKAGWGRGPAGQGERVRGCRGFPPMTFHAGSTRLPACSMLSQSFRSGNPGSCLVLFF